MSRSRKEGEFTKTEEKGFIMEESDRVEAYPAGHPPFILLYGLIIIYLATLRIVGNLMVVFFSGSCKVENKPPVNSRKSEVRMKK